MDCGALVYQAANCLEVVWLEDGGDVEILSDVSTDSAGWIVKSLTVIMSVFDGGEGVIREGTSDRSIESGVLGPDDRRLEVSEVCCVCWYSSAVSIGGMTVDPNDILTANSHKKLAGGWKI